MKAVVCKKAGGGLLTLSNVPIPEIKEREVLVKIRAATVTPSDVAGMGSFRIVRLFGGAAKSKEPIPGVEFAGEIAQIGKDVKCFKTGDRVFGSSLGYGAWAEYIRVSEDGTLTKMPADMDFVKAVGVCDGGITALLFLQDHAQLSAGKTILINGASGAVGTYAVQLARYYGAEVTAICSTAHVELIKSLGVNNVIDYTKEDYIHAGGHYDVIFDTVGKSSFLRCKKLLTQNGAYMTTVPTPDTVVRTLFASKKSGRRAVFAATGLAKPDVRRKALDMLRELAEEGKLISIVDRQYALEQINDAVHYVAEGHKTGNVVVTPQD
jgi:NADPH:quinone reductase-like Zn-dependent oxidoreductase